MKLIHGDCRQAMLSQDSASADSMVTDPPAGIGFMGARWDKTPNRDSFVYFLQERFLEARRVVKPGAYALVWALPRTSHWTALALEEAGWAIRDRVSHLFGTGFPKAKSCLKPACEDWWLALNPGTTIPPLQIDACRVPGQPEPTRFDPAKHSHEGWRMSLTGAETAERAAEAAGRWPANVTHDGSDEVLEGFPHTKSGTIKEGQERVKSKGLGGYGNGMPDISCLKGFAGDEGSAARFFYCAKASRSDKGEGNTHPTVKNTELMRWLCRLITPPAGVVLDPFMGSGSTGKACLAEGFDFVGIEADPEYHKIATRRLETA